METPRLILRQWKVDDYDAFAQINADSETMRYFPATLTREESDEMADKCKALIEKKGFGFWAVELKETGEFIGLVGLRYQMDEIPEAPFYEIGWRLSRRHWGKGLAPEAANEALRFAFEEIGAKEVYAFTTISNEPSRRVMTKLGMVNTHNNFNHPLLPEEHPLVRHCLYKISSEVWKGLPA